MYSRRKQCESSSVCRLQDIELEEEVTFSSITTHTAAPPLLQMLFARIEHELDDCDWSVGQLRSSVTDRRTDAGE